MKVETIQNLIPRAGDDLSAEHLQSTEYRSVDDLPVTVVFTTPEGTRAALRTASNLAKGLGSRIRLVAPEFVPFQFPLNRPPVAIEFLERRLYDLVCAADIPEGEIVIQLFLCRDEYACLRRVLNAHSLVVIGQRRRWFGRASRLERFLKSLGHQVIAAPARARKGFRGDWNWESFWTRVLSNLPAGRPEMWSWDLGSFTSDLPETQSASGLRGRSRSAT